MSAWIDTGLLDFEELDRQVELASGGDERAGSVVRAACVSLVRRVTSWQWVIHGETQAYRESLCDKLCDDGKFKQAKAVACCGRGDTAYLEDGGSRAKVRSRCCGHRLCPRCSRRGGRRSLRRVAAHLSTEPHGAIDHFVLTQQVHEGERLSDARERFAKKWAHVYKVFRKVGLRSALVTYHVKRSRSVSWHYHAHVVVEWGEATDLERARDAIDYAWNMRMKASGEPMKPIFWRSVCEAGDPIVGFEAREQGELWKESGDPVTQVLQYAVRDVLQGVESWVDGVVGAELLDEFASAVGGAKLHRLYGEWRKRVEDVSEQDSERQASVVSANASVEGGKETEVTRWVKLGTVDRCIRWARTGIWAGSEWLRALQATCSNKSCVGLRVRALLRTIGSHAA